MRQELFYTLNLFLLFTFFQISLAFAGPPLENVALGKPVIDASGSVYGTYEEGFGEAEGWKKIVDGDFTNEWLTWGNRSGMPAKATVDLQNIYDLDNVGFKVSWDTTPGHGDTAEIGISVSRDNENWQTLDTVTAGQNEYLSVYASGVYARYVKIEWLGEQDNGWGRIRELEVFGAPNQSTGKTIVDPTGEVYGTYKPGFGEPEGWNKIVDGDFSTSWLTWSNHHNHPTSAVIDLKQITDLTSLTYQVNWDKRDGYGDTAEIQILGSLDNENWELIDTRLVTQDTFVAVEVYSSYARYVKLAWVGELYNGWGRIIEFEVYGTPEIPEKLELNPYSVVLTELAAEVELKLNISLTNPAIAQKIIWNSSNPKAVSVVQSTVDQGIAKVRAEGYGSATITATYNNMIAETNVLVVEAGSDTKVISSSDLRIKDSMPGKLSLNYNPHTATIEVGDILISDSTSKLNPGILAKVTEINQVSSLSGATRIIASFEVSSLDEAFDYYSFSYGNPIAQLANSNAGDGYPTSGTMKLEDAAALFPQGIECKAKGGANNAITFTVFNLTAIPFRVSPVIDILIDRPNDKRRIYIAFDLISEFELTGPTVAASSAFTGSFECYTELPDTMLGIIPALPAGVLSIAPELSSSIGLTGSMSLKLGKAELSTFKLGYNASARYGIDYSYDAGIENWTPIKERVSGDITTEGPAITIDTDSEFNASIGPFLGLGLGAGIRVFTAELVEMKVAEGKYQVPVAIKMPANSLIYPSTPPNDNYENPNWSVSHKFKVNLKPGLDWGDTFKVMIKPPPSPPVSLNLTLLNITSVIAETPDMNLVLPESVASGEPVDIQLNLRPFQPLHALVYAGQTATFWAKKGNELIEIGHAIIDSTGSASFQWTPPSDAAYQIVATVDQLVFFNYFDHVTDTVPLVVGNPTVQNLWPSFMRDGSANTYNPLETVLYPPLELETKILPPAGSFRPIYVSPSVSDDKLFVVSTTVGNNNGSLDTIISAYDLDSIELSHETTIPGNNDESSMVIQGDRLYVPIGEYNNGLDPTPPAVVHVFSTENLEKLAEFTFPNNEPYHELFSVADNENLYITYQQGIKDMLTGVIAFDRLSGDIKWNTILPEHWSGRPRILDDAIVIGQDSKLVVVNKIDGSIKYIKDLLDNSILKDGDGFVIDEQNRRIIVNLSGSAQELPKVLALDIDTGATIWETNGNDFYNHNIANLNPMYADNNLFVIAENSMSKQFRIYDLNSGELNTATNMDEEVGEQGYTFEYMTLANGVIYLTSFWSGRPLVYAVDTTTGAGVWTSNEVGDIYLPPIVAAGKLIISGNGGTYIYRNASQ